MKKGRVKMSNPFYFILFLFCHFCIIYFYLFSWKMAHVTHKMKQNVLSNLIYMKYNANYNIVYIYCTLACNLELKNYF